MHINICKVINVHLHYVRWQWILVSLRIHTGINTLWKRTKYAFMVNECLPYDAVCSKMHFVSFCCAHMFQSEILTGCTRFGSNSIFCVNTWCVSAHVFDSKYGHIDVCLFERKKTYVLVWHAAKYIFYRLYYSKYLF